MSKKHSPPPIDPERLEAIKRELAYQIWEQNGCPEGRSEEHWHAACNLIEARLADTTTLPDWLKRTEQPAETVQETATEEDAVEQLKPATAARLQDVARRFARSTS